MRCLILCTATFAALTSHAQIGNNLNLLDPNLAERNELLALPNITDQLADAVIAARPISSTSELDIVVSAILNEEQRTELYGQLFRQIDLNSATEVEIMLIPGMTSRMTHEFEEYRPYTSLEQFRREIGKYVDENEVARLESYIALD